MKSIASVARGAVIITAVLCFGMFAVQAMASGHGEQTEHQVDAVEQLVDAVEHGAVDAGHGDAHAVQDSLSPAKLKDLLWRAMNFLALMVILVKFGAKPIASALSNRQRQIKDEFEDLGARKTEAETRYDEFQTKLTSVEKDVDTIVSKAVAQAEIEKKKILENADKAAGDIQRQSENAVNNEVAASRRMLKGEAVDKATVAAEDLIVKNLTPEDQVKIIEDYLDKVGAVQ